MPIYQLDILLSELPRVEARQLRRDIQATTAPHLKPSDRRALLHRLDRAAQVRVAAPTTSDTERVHDPVAAAAWFAERGVRTV